MPDKCANLISILYIYCKQEGSYIDFVHTELKEDIFVIVF